MAGRVLVKPGVEFAVIAPAGYCLLVALKRAARDLGVDLTITSATDGVHSGPTDPHYSGEAFDVRTHDLDSVLRPRLIDAVLSQLGRDRFFGFLEAPGTSNEHAHFQRRNGTTFHLTEWLAT